MSDPSSGGGAGAQAPDTSEAVTRSVVIPNARGLHARAAAKFVDLARRFDAVVMVSREDMNVNADSIMEVLMLAAAQGATITIRARGADAQDAVAALAALVEDGFGEMSAPLTEE